ncbi:hypothetical protein Tco_1419098 [Tanacetum coccineum]
MVLWHNSSRACSRAYAPFSKYPPMKVFLTTLQNAPRGLDYEGDKKFSKSFKQMIASWSLLSGMLLFSKYSPMKQVDQLGLDKREASNMTVHNSNLEMDGDDQDSSTVIIGYCPDMFPAFKVSLQFHGVPMIALICLHVPKMTALYYGTLILPRSPLNFQVGPIRILMSIGQWHPKLHGVISASSFHGKIGIYKVEACARYSVGEDSDHSCDDLDLDWSWLCKKTSNEGYSRYPYEAI